MASFLLPSRVQVVDTLETLLTQPFGYGANAMCLPRNFDVDIEDGFNELAQMLVTGMSEDDDLVAVDEHLLKTLPVSSAGRRAALVLCEDLLCLREHGRDPTLNCIRAYATDDRGLPIATDVMSFHVDRADIEVDTFLCTYAGAPSELLDNDDATRLIDDHAIRSMLRAATGAPDDDAFADIIRHGSFDLHYRPKPGARVFSCGRFALWKLAVAWPGARVPPCIHRAPSTTPADPPRLLLIA